MNTGSARLLLLLMLTTGCGFCCYATVAAVAPTRLSALLVSAVGVLVAVQLARFCHQQLRMYWMTRHLPGPSPTWPLLGNALDVYVPQEDMVDLLMDMRKRFGPTFRIWAGPYLAIFCFEPEDLQVIFSHQHLTNKAFVYDAFSSIIGSGLLNLGSSHHRHQSAIMPSFHRDIIRSLIPAFALEGNKLTKAMQHLSHSGETFNAIKLTERAVSHIVCETLLGYVNDKLIDTLGDQIRQGAELMMFVLLRPWFAASDLCCRLLAPGAFSEKQRLYKLLDGLTRSALDFKEAQLHDKKLLQDKEHLQDKEVEDQLKGNKPLKDEQLCTVGSGKVTDLLEHILNSKEGALISRDELSDDLKHLLTGAIVSTADLLAVLMLSLAVTPDVQDKVHQELDKVFADDPSRPVTADDLPRLRYLEMTIKEVLRHFPVIPIYARSAADDVTLPSGTVVPRGSMVVVFPRVVHLDPRWYPDPSVFDPDHHKPEVADTRPNFTFIPFSGGSRSCIGQRFAMALSKTIAATVLREYRFLPAPGGVQTISDLKLVIGVALHLVGGVNVRLERR